VKITPAHDPNDYEVGLRQTLGMQNIMNPDGTLNDSDRIPKAYRGLTMKKAREKVVADLEALGLLDRIEDREIEVAHSDRSKTAIEPYLADQWFVKMSDHDDGRPGLAQTAMDAVSDGRVQITPTRYAKSYLDWLSEKRDWPVSRQLWWGHRIPVWTIRQSNFGPERDSQAESDRVIDALNAFASAFDIQSELWIKPVALWSDQFYVCAGSDKAEAALRGLYKRRHVDPADDPAPGDRLQLDTDAKQKAVETLKAVVADVDDQDEGVLDTWFSSALWPHSTLGWPEKTPELAEFYPTSVLLTSRDIITLWVARMVLTGLYNVGSIPFHQVYIHPKILDGFGETMSKSKGNGVDPLDVIAKFGADSLRFALASMATETQDVRMPVEFECPHCLKSIEQTHKNRILPRVKCKHCDKEFSTQWAKSAEDIALLRGAVISERFEVARNFCNKLWNASRFALMNLEGYTFAPVDIDKLTIEDRWVLSRLSTVTAQVTAAIESFRFADAARVLYDFAWDEFCSFYVEMIKTRLQDPASRPVAQRVLAYTLDTLLRLLHPMVPFVTEEVWHLLSAVAPSRGLTAVQPISECIAVASWPAVDAGLQNAAIEEQFAKFQQLLGGLREVRARQNIAPKTPIRFAVRCDAATVSLLQPMEPYFAAMAGATATAWGPEVESPALSANFNSADCEVFVDLAEHIDIGAEISRNEKELEKIAGFIAAKEKKLSNESFVSRAPADVITREREQLEELHTRQKSTEQALAELRKKR
ncbi:MAG: class I tRNA ligase family protein, partial [Planctomycetota bacterium]|nr:class I tRNA ligase family protein [Planctomycetota bacterium]